MRKIRLVLDRDAVALVFAAPLAIETVAILDTWRCPSLVLCHPYAPEHRVVLAGEPYPVSLAWPAGVHRMSGVVRLPPTLTARGPISWAYRPNPQGLRLCREIDVRTALRAAQMRPTTADGR
ncbi:MAG: hypothetical protein ACRDSZ_13500 [Pseudonocardiaceae bacterium]